MIFDDQGGPKDKRWVVWRQDEQGNCFRVETGLTKEDAEALVREYESHGHKQLYWAEGPLR